MRWTNQGRNPHNIVGTGEVDRVRAEVRRQPAGFTPQGGTYEFKFTKPGVYLYYCSLHGTPDQGMVGAVIVGDEDWTPPKTRAAVAKKSGTLDVPDDYATIQAAVDAAAEGAMVLIQPGVYHEAVVVNSPNIVIRGTDRNTTILDGDLSFDNGFHVFADGVAIENMTARRYATNGFFWDGVTGYRGSYLTAYNNGDYGIYTFASVSGQFDHSYASGSPDSSFYIGQCRPCKAVITDVTAEYSELGYSGTNGSDVTIVNSVFRKNRIGIVPNSQDVEELPPVKRRTRSSATSCTGTTTCEAATADNPLYDALVGSGIAMTGTVDSLVARNRVYDHAWFGIVLAPFPSDPNFYKVETTKVVDNVVDGQRPRRPRARVRGAGAGATASRATRSRRRRRPSIEQRAPCTGKGLGDLTVGAVRPSDVAEPRRTRRASRTRSSRSRRRNRTCPTPRRRSRCRRARRRTDCDAVDTIAVRLGNSPGSTDRRHGASRRQHVNRNFSQTITVRCDDPAVLIEMLEQWDLDQATTDIMGYMGRACSPTARTPASTCSSPTSASSIPTFRRSRRPSATTSGRRRRRGRRACSKWSGRARLPPLRRAVPDGFRMTELIVLFRAGGRRLRPACARGRRRAVARPDAGHGVGRADAREPRDRRAVVGAAARAGIDRGRHRRAVRRRSAR